MKKIKIFLASSMELEDERREFGDFINGLRNAFEPQGIDLKLVKWEYLNSAYNGRPKEDEYLDELKECQLFVALFHTVAGKYTQQELEEARRSLEAYKVPSILIFMKDLVNDEKASPELIELKDKILNDKKWQHFNDTYNHIDTLKLRFLQQFIINLKDSSLSLEVEDSVVRFNKTEIAKMDNMSFAANNSNYQELKQKIAEANKDIEGLEQLLGNGPNPFLEEMINKQKKLRTELREKLDKCEKDLLASSQRIAALKKEGMNQRTMRVIELFEKGDSKGADELLNFKDIQNDINWIRDDVETAWENAKSLIFQLMFKAQNLLTLDDNPNRIDEADRSYAMALDCAKKVRLGEEYRCDLYDKYQTFLVNQGRYDKALEVCKEWIRTSVFAFGQDHFLTANAYNSMGNVLSKKGQYDKALENYLKSLEIRKSVFGDNHALTAATYNNIGEIYNSLGRFSEALESYVDALMIFENVFGKNHHATATTYNNIGGVYNSLGEYSSALKYYLYSLKVYLKVFGDQHPTTATAYNNIGYVYNKQGKYDEALNNYNEALRIRRKVFGSMHPSTAITYNNIGYLYFNRGVSAKAVENFQKAARIQEVVYGKAHPSLAITYNNMAKAHNSQGNYDKALDYFEKALEIKEKFYNKEHPSIAITYNNMGAVYDNLGYYIEAERYLDMALAIREKVLGKEHPATASTYNNLGKLHSDREEYNLAIDFLNKALKIWEKVFGKVHIETSSAYHNLGEVYYKLGQYSKALEYYGEALNARDQLLDNHNTDLIKTLWGMTRTYEKLGDKSEARLYMERLAQLQEEQAKEWIEKNKD